MIQNSLQKSASWIRRMQRANIKTKKRFVIVSTACAMVLVIGLWVVYINMVIPSLDRSGNGATAAESSAFATFKLGFQKIWADGKEKLSEAREKIKTQIDSVQSSLETNVVIEKPEKETLATTTEEGN